MGREATRVILEPVPKSQWASVSVPWDLHVQMIEAENHRLEEILNPSEETKKRAEEVGMTVEQLLCRSTHGGAGYSISDYWNEDGNIVCGGCGFIIENPRAFARRTEYRKAGLFKRQQREVPDWGFLGSPKIAIDKYFERYPERDWH